MPDNTLTCAEARRSIDRYLAGEACPPLAAHLASCDSCRMACIENALKQQPAVAIPPRFAARVAAGLPADRPERSWAPAAAAILFVLLGLILWLQGEGPAVARGLLHWQVLAATAAIEAALALAWAFRIANPEE